MELDEHRLTQMNFDELGKMIESDQIDSGRLIG